MKKKSGIMVRVNLRENLGLDLIPIVRADEDTSQVKIVCGRVGVGISSMFTREKVLKILSTGIYYITYEKVSGENVNRKATLNKEHLTDIGVFKEDSKTGIKTSDEVVRYWDLDRAGWRSFRIDRLITVLKIS